MPTGVPWSNKINISGQRWRSGSARQNPRRPSLVRGSSLQTSGLSDRLLGHLPSFRKQPPLECAFHEIPTRRSPSRARSPAPHIQTNQVPLRTFRGYRTRARSCPQAFGLSGRFVRLHHKILRTGMVYHDRRRGLLWLEQESAGQADADVLFWIEQREQLGLVFQVWTRWISERIA